MLDVRGTSWGTKGGADICLFEGEQLSLLPIDARERGLLVSKRHKLRL